MEGDDRGADGDLVEVVEDAGAGNSLAVDQHAVAAAVVAGFFSAFLAGAVGVATGFLAGSFCAAPESFAGGSFAGGSCANKEAFNTNKIK